jgi:hypothetical protein
VAEVKVYRKMRMINLEAFIKASQEVGVIILDTRLTERYNASYIKGAKHLNFSDFTQQNFAQIIPNANTKILIYCNNNIDGDQINFASKVVLPSMIKTQKVKPITLALNIPTYINLYGYGYRNVYELSELVSINDKRLDFEASGVKK